MGLGAGLDTENLAATGIRSPDLLPVPSRYTDYAIPASLYYVIAHFLVCCLRKAMYVSVCLTHRRPASFAVAKETSSTFF